MEQGKQDVGIDLHRSWSVLVRRNETGVTIDTVRIDNDPIALSAEAGPQPEGTAEHRHRRGQPAT